MSDNSKTVSGYLLPASITAEQIRNACLANGYSMMFVARDENPTGMFMHIIEALGHPVFRGVRVETAAQIRAVSGAHELDCAAFNPSVVPDSEYTDVVRRSDMDIARAGDMAALRDMDHKNAALHRTITRLTDALSRISNAPPSIYDARNFRTIARAALHEGGAVSMSDMRKEWEQWSAKMKEQNERVARIADNLVADGSTAKAAIEKMFDALRAPDQAEIRRLKLINEIAMQALELAEELFEVGLLEADPAFIARVHEARKTALKWGDRA